MKCWNPNVIESIQTGMTVAVLLLEYWLGKTDKTKSGSLLELIKNVMKSIIKKTGE